ncbi:MAG: NAD(P)-dependent oxidoreductase [Pseudomonadota bacterium]
MKIAFIGLGVQGKGLAKNAVAGGHEVTVFDPRPEPCAELAALGATVAGSNADAGKSAQVIQVCVLNDAQVESVIAGPAGLLSSAQPGTIIAVHSTIRPATIVAMAAKGLEKGVIVIDAPVSGGAAGAEAKRMSFMVGGPPEALDVCRPVFQSSGDRIAHIGELGSALRAKLAHQLIISVNLLAAYEGMKLGVMAGVPAELLEQVVRDGAAQSYVTHHWSTLVLGPQAPAVFYKDLQLCIELANSLGLSVPGAALAQQLMEVILADHRIPKEQKQS